MLVFKGFKKYKVHLLTAVVVNYATCTIIGLLYLFANSSLDNLAFNSWMYFAIGIGILFILVFYGMGYVTEKMGVSTSTVASKMGVVFPIVYGLTFLQENFNI
jgi:drug/metabolite transporter (DMT)-like permease